MTFLVLSIVLFLISRGWNHWRTWKDERTMLQRLTLRPRLDDPDPSAPSIHEMIVAQAAERPDEPLDYTPFPDLPAGEGESFVPGARDLFDTSPKPAREEARTQILAAVQAIRSLHIADARTLELYVRDTDPYDHYHGVIEALPGHGNNVKVRKLFQEMALAGRDYNAVKWGIVIGAVGASLEELTRMTSLARNAELAPHVCRALLWARKRHPAVIDLLIDLLAVGDQWGFVHIYHHVVADSGRIDDPAVQRKALIHGMRRGGDAMPGLATRFLKQLDLHRLFEIAQSDGELAEALMTLVEVVLTSPEPPGALAPDEEGEAMIESLMMMMSDLPPSIDKARGLRAVCIALGVETLAWPSRERLINEAYEAFIGTLSPEILSEAIGGDYHRVDALLMIAELGIEPMLPIVFEDFRRHPDPMNIEVLGRLGEGEHLHAIFNALPNAEETARRTSMAEEGEIAEELLKGSANYAAIVRHIGKLAGPETIDRIKSAATDFHPWVRAAAMTAMMSIQRWTLDAESRELVQACMEDNFDFVRDAARETAAYHYLKVAGDGANGLILSQNLDVSLN